MSVWSSGFVALDWGTTNRRAYVIDAVGRLIDQMEDDGGILSLPTSGLEAEVHRLRSRFGGKPLLLAGMVGSNRGWIEAPYVPCPATRSDIAANIRWAEPGEIAIVPGLSYVSDGRADVMRGEEVQIVGVQALGLAPAAARICHPGTHTKWIDVEGGRIAGFRTIMTGELFSLLKEHSILAELLGAPVAPTGAFLEGVDRGMATGALDAELFSVRARVLLGIGEAAQAASFASGLLIGCNLRTALEPTDVREVIVVGRPTLTTLYAAAIGHCGRTARQIDGAHAFVAGARAIAEEIR